MAKPRARNHRHDEAEGDRQQREEHAGDHLGEDEVPAFDTAPGDHADRPPVVFVAHHRAAKDDADERGEEPFQREAVRDDVLEGDAVLEGEQSHDSVHARVGAIPDTEPEDDVEEAGESHRRRKEDVGHPAVGNFEPLGA